MPKKQAQQRRSLLRVSWSFSAVRAPATLDVVGTTCGFAAAVMISEMGRHLTCASYPLPPADVNICKDVLAMSSQQLRSQIESRFSAVNAIRCGFRSVCLTLLVSPDSAVFVRGVLFSFLVKIHDVSVRVYRYMPI